ncbi:ArsA family ATPase, partial [Fusobacterium sp.]
MRILIYTGKGGVGKTSIAAATAFFLANSGKKVILMSTDQAHSLGDVLDKKLNGKISQVFQNLDVVEIDTIEESQKVWRNLQDYLKQIISAKANDGIEIDEALLFPGLEEIFSLLKILDIYEANEYDVMVVDCAPTGQSLSMLTYSEKLNMLADTILPMVQSINSIFGSFISKKTSVPKPRDIVFEEFKSLVKRLTKLYEIFHKRDSTSIRIVTTPEQIVLEEARRNYTWLQLYNFNVDAVYMNKLYPKEAMEGYFEGWE